MTNSADPDQLLLQKPTDLDLHCLLRQGMSCLAREGLSLFSLKKYFRMLSAAVVIGALRLKTFSACFTYNSNY